MTRSHPDTQQPAHRPRKKLLLSVKRPVLILISAYLKDVFSTINSASLIISVSHISTQISPVPPHCAVPFSLKSQTVVPSRSPSLRPSVCSAGSRTLGLLNSLNSDHVTVLMCSFGVLEVPTSPPLLQLCFHTRHLPPCHSMSPYKDGGEGRGATLCHAEIKAAQLRPLYLHHVVLSDK